MGYQNVALVFARWGHLPDRPFRLLTFMALRSRDEDDPPRFYEGRVAAALAIGKLTPDEPAPGDESDRANESRKARRNDFEAVKVATRALIRAGVIEVVEGSARGQHATYALFLDAPTGKGYPGQQGRVTPSTGKGYPGQQGRVTPSSTRLPPTGEGSKPHDQMTTTPNSSSGGTSPGANGEIEYQTANELLMKMADWGEEFMKRVTDIESVHDRVIAAAELARAERPELRVLPGGAS